MPRDDKIDALASDLDRLRVAMERFFNGADAVPPDAERKRLERRLRELRSRPMPSSAESFRLGGLEASLHSLTERYQRRLLAREGLGPLRATPAAAGLEAGAPPAVGRGAPARAGRSAESGAARPGDASSAAVVLGDELHRDGVERLLRELSPGSRAELRRGQVAAFRRYLDRQLTTIRKRTGCDAVQVRVVSEGGKKKLKARPVEAEASAGRGRSATGE